MHCQKRKKRLSRKTFICSCGRQIAVFRLNVASQCELSLLLLLPLKCIQLPTQKLTHWHCILYIFYCMPSGCFLFVSCLPEANRIFQCAQTIYKAGVKFALMQYSCCTYGGCHSGGSYAKWLQLQSCRGATSRLPVSCNLRKCIEK